ncbi:AAA family ATPase [Endozoicomonas gorgoniicola]|uniref:AAA family ATPase n=1 Tax=Endozoicomonas gorgoniicola TaxID=1234144 RepID=A0ABT3MUX6_9GAMM|nr:AAA family ATPase [Endozoicomonas gorgoniicola]MCW7553185.1 AAA family ATPase [Endozoicomonas gorgoniicola]
MDVFLLLLQTFSEAIPFQTHRLHDDQPAFFEVEFVLEGRDYKYRLELTPSAVIHESLHVKTSHLYSYLFIREREGDSYSYRQKGFDFKKTLAEKVRGNASVIPAAQVHDSAEAGQFIRFFDSFVSNIYIFGKRHYNDRDLLESAQFFDQSERYHGLTNQLICQLDLGLSAIELNEASSVNEKGEEEKIIG